MDASNATSTPADGGRYRRRQGFPALGISVLESAANPNGDLPDIKFRSNVSAERRPDLELQSAMMKGRTKEQAQILAIANGLKEGIEDLLAGRVFRPAEPEEVADSSSNAADSDASSNPKSPASPKDVERQEEELADTVETNSPAPSKIKKKMAGMPGWMKSETDEQGDEGSSEGSGPADESDDDSVTSFLNINHHDIIDIVEETDQGKLEQQVNAGRAATNSDRAPHGIMYEWKEFARVRLTEELHEWFQARNAKNDEEVAQLDNTEASGKEAVALQSEGVREVKSSVEAKEIALFTTVSCFQQKCAKRIDEHWDAKRKVAEKVLAQVQKEEEEKRQERLRRQQERAAKRFHDIDDQIADLKDNIEQIRGEIHKKELMKRTAPSNARRNSTGNKVTEVLSTISAQQEEVQILSAKLAMSSRKLESWEDAVEKAKLFFSSAAFKSKKMRLPPADDPSYMLVNEAVVKHMQEILAQLMLEDDALAESISVAFRTFGRPAGKKKVKNGFLKLEDLHKDQKLSGSESFQHFEEVVVSSDPVERQHKFQEIEAESAALREEIEILQGALQQPISVSKPQQLTDQQDTAPRRTDTESGERAQPPAAEEAQAPDANSMEEAYRTLLSVATDTVEIIRQKKAVLSSERHKSKSRTSEFPTQGGLVQSSTSITSASPPFPAARSQAEQQLKEQRQKAARLSKEEKALKIQLMRLRAAAGTSDKASKDRSKDDKTARTSKTAGATEAQGLDGRMPRSKSAGGPQDPGTTSLPLLVSDQPSGVANEARSPAGRQESKSRRQQEAANPDAALAKQLKDNEEAAQELEAVRKQLHDLKNASNSAEGMVPSGSSQRPRRNSKVQAAEPLTESAGDATPSIASPSSGAGPQSRSRRSSSRRSVAASPRGASKMPEEPPVSQEEREQNALKLKDLLTACQKLTEEKEAFEKELASIEDKIRRVKSMDSGGVVAMLKKDVQQEKKADSTEVKELKAEIKKKTSQVNAMRRTWQEMQGSSGRRSNGAAADEERQREVAKRFAHVLAFLRAAKAAELAKEAESSGMVTESGDAGVVGRSASKFLMSIRKGKMAEQLSENLRAQEARTAPHVAARRPSLTSAMISPSPMPMHQDEGSPGPSRQGFNRMMAEAMTGQRGAPGPCPSASSDEEVAARPSRRASMSMSSSLQVPRTTDDGEMARRRSFNNILEKAKMRKRPDESVATPGAKANSAVRFAPEDG